MHGTVVHRKCFARQNIFQIVIDIYKFPLPWLHLSSSKLITQYCSLPCQDQDCPICPIYPASQALATVCQSLDSGDRAEIHKCRVLTHSHTHVRPSELVGLRCSSITRQNTRNCVHSSLPGVDQCCNISDRLILGRDMNCN